MNTITYNDAETRAAKRRADSNHCLWCRAQIDYTGFYALVKHDGKIKCVCSKPDCTDKTVEYLKKQGLNI